MSKVDWNKLLTPVRRKTRSGSGHKVSAPGPRTEGERDFDRILFCTPVRRLADKTQVFPLEKNDSVRTRLTHSHEVSNIARSIGVALCYTTSLFDSIDNAERHIPPILAAVGLAHDIGNPPFGHQGELSIGSWFEANAKKVFGDDPQITEQMRQDYLRFEGNAQALRILTRLQIINDKFGLNLTCASLAALLKYPCASDEVDEDVKIRKKFGYFYSEKEICQEIWDETSLKEWVRHPLTYIMEASDDIAYSILDAEDSVKKFLVSYRDLIAYLRANAYVEENKKDDPLILDVIARSEVAHEKYKEEKLCPSELNDLSMQMFRVIAIEVLVNSVIDSFQEHYDAICDGTFKNDLIGGGKGKWLCKHLKAFSFKHAYKHRSVLELELRGHKIIHSLMDMLWLAITSRGDPLLVDKHPGDPFQVYAYSRISENYKRVFEDKDNNLPLAYKQVQLLSDMISGMTDSFARDFESELRSYRLDE